MLSQYKNIEQILTAQGAVSAQRYPQTLLNLFETNYYSYIPEPGISLQTTDYRTELHIYSGETWITGNHLIQHVPTSTYFNSAGTQLTLTQPVSIDIYNQFEALGVNLGNYRIVLNFFKNLIGSFDEQYLKIDEISPDRTELKLRLIDSANTTALQQLSNFADTIQNSNAQTAVGNSTGFISIPFQHRTFLLNFSRNEMIHFVNSVVVGEYLYVKLYNALPDSIEKDFRLWVVEERKQPYIDKVSIIPATQVRTFNQLAGANWDAVGDSNLSTPTEYRNWTQILGSGLQTSQQIIDAYFSGSLQGVKLNIDYTDFNNFVFYSSATERVDNFKYKLELLEFYNTQANAVSQLSGSVATTNASDFESERTAVISGFDNFEKFLYYESSSVFYSNPYPHPDPIVPQQTGSYITPAPKTSSTRPYALAAVTSSEFIDWYTELTDYAVAYDSFNDNSLVKTLPEHIRFNEINVNAATFVNMLGHHYDILYTYVNYMSKIHNRDENPKLGMPNELLYSVAKQFGWNLVDGKQGEELWSYLLGTDESGTPNTGSNSVTGIGTPTQELTFTTWRRIVNNIPGLLKSKGTKRSIQALLACYGIPQTLMTIKEYGGPRNNRRPVYEKLNFDYALDLINNSAGTVTVNYDQPVNSVELRFRTDDVLENPTLPGTMHLYTIDGNDVTIDFQSGTYGSILINGTASAAIEMFDGGWLNTVLRTNGSLLEIVAKRSKYGNIVATTSASATTSISDPGTLVIGGTSTGAVRLQGQVQELRLWNTSLQDDPFANHTKAPAAYDGNSDAYDELVFRIPLSQKINHTTTASLSGVEPNLSGISASFAGWSTATPYDSLEETYYYDGISIAAGTYDDNKIRLTDNELVGSLDVITRATRSTTDDAPIDSKKLGVYFSPQTMIDEDIIAQLGFTIIDDYIGDPGNTEQYSYPRLTQFAMDYWKKYAQSNDINAYISIFALYDLSFFQQLNQLLPARVDRLTGILVQPNLLERSKDTTLPSVSRELFTYEAEIDLTADGTNVTGEYDTIDVVIDAIPDDLITGEYNNIDGLIEAIEDALNTNEPFIPAVQDSVPSDTYLDEFDNPAEIQDYLPDGLNNAFYNGTQTTAPDINLPSDDTVDGGPVVETTITNPNQIINVPPNQPTGNFGSSGPAELDFNIDQ
jgi:hypothetical protein